MSKQQSEALWHKVPNYVKTGRHISPDGFTLITYEASLQQHWWK